MSAETYVPKYPLCDFCRPLDTDAHYDGQTRMGKWAHMCDVHFDENGVGLGTGKGQLLKLGEPPERDRRAEAHAALLANDFEAFEDAVGDGDPLDFLM